MLLMRLANFALASLLWFGGHAAAQGPVIRSSGQVLYLPIYSHVWHGDLDSRGEPAKALVSISVSIRNTDPLKSIRVTSAQYYDTAILRRAMGLGFGAVTTKTITRHPRPGHPDPNLVRSPMLWG